MAYVYKGARSMSELVAAVEKMKDATLLLRFYRRSFERTHGEAAKCRIAELEKQLEAAKGEASAIRASMCSPLSYRTAEGRYYS